MTVAALETKSAAERSQRPADDVRAAVLALQELLLQEAEFVAGLTDAQYAQAPDADGSSIGCHLRHALDHVRALLLGVDLAVIDYDRRERGTDIERFRSAALGLIRRLHDELRCLFAARADQPIRVQAMLRPDGTAVSARSSQARELVFVLNHTAHHHAMMAATARRFGAAVSPSFGYAPSTLAHRERSSCVPSAY